MEKGRLLFILLVIISLGVGAIFWTYIPGLQTKTSGKLPPHSFVKNILTQEQQSAAEAYSKPPPATVSPEVLQEAARSGMLDQNPAASEKRLDELAGRLSDQDIESMAEIVKTPSNNGDLRALAVDLLARTKATSVLSPLEQIIISKWPASADPRVTGFEQSLRARAIEGLEGHPSRLATEILQRALHQTDDSFLNDHGQRALLHRQGQARSVEEQDQEALAKLLKK